MKRRQFIILGLAGASGLLLQGGAINNAYARKIYTGILSNTALGGYDAVAYFSAGKPIKGVTKYQTKWQGVKWNFSNAKNLAKFKANPRRYAPQYGGYCAYGVAKNSLVKGDPLLWKIVNGKLYLNINRNVVSLWKKDIPGFIRSANKNWPKLDR